MPSFSPSLPVCLSFSPLKKSPSWEFGDTPITMGEKTSTIILKVDLDCCHCYKKIRKLLCKLQGCWNMQTIAYDEKKNTVTISGPFDPHKLSKKLLCKACKVIKEIHIKEKEEPQKPKPAEPPPNPEPVPCYLVCPPGPVCRCRPCYVGYYGGYGCSSCTIVEDQSCRIM